MLNQQFMLNATKIAKRNVSIERQTAHDREYRAMRLASRDDFALRVKAGRAGYDLDIKTPTLWN